jgi:hypothetical protein
MLTPSQEKYKRRLAWMMALVIGETLSWVYLGVHLQFLASVLLLQYKTCEVTNPLCNSSHNFTLLVLPLLERTPLLPERIPPLLERTPLLVERWAEQQGILLLDPLLLLSTQHPVELRLQLLEGTSLPLLDIPHLLSIKYLNNAFKNHLCYLYLFFPSTVNLEQIMPGGGVFFP